MVKQMLYVKKASKGKIPHMFETSKYQKCPIKAPKNHLVIALFEIFGPVRNKLLVTVSLDHPVVVYRILDIVFKTAPITSAKHISLNVHLTNVVDTHAISWSNIRLRRPQLRSCII